MSDASNSNSRRTSSEQCTNDNETTKLDISKVSQTASPTTTQVTKSSMPTWSHEPKALTLLWLAMAIPVVFMDASFILGRPFTFASGALHSLLGPLWTPWDIYQKVDYVYSKPIFDERDGWPGAQALFNVIETSCFAWYMLSAARYSVGQSDKTADLMDCQLLFAKKSVKGKRGVAMAMVLCTVMMVTVVKTALYFLVEVFAGFKHINHNSFMDSLFLYWIPNGLWLVFPSIISYSAGKELVSGLVMVANPN